MICFVTHLFVFVCVYNNIPISHFFKSLLENEVASRKAQLAASQQRLSSTENEIKQNESHLHHHRQHQKELQVKIGITFLFRS